MIPFFFPFMWTGGGGGATPEWVVIGPLRILPVTVVIQRR